MSGFKPHVVAALAALAANPKAPDVLKSPWGQNRLGRRLEREHGPRCPKCGDRRTWPSGDTLRCRSCGQRFVIAETTAK